MVAGFIGLFIEFILLKLGILLILLVLVLIRGYLWGCLIILLKLNILGSRTFYLRSKKLVLRNLLVLLIRLVGLWLILLLLGFLLFIGF